MHKTAFVAVMVLVAIASCTKKAAPTTAKANSIDGAPIFAQYCVRCHGATGVEGRAPNLKKTDFTKSEIASTVAKGRGHMPGFSDKLSAQQIDAVAEFVTHLKK